AELKRLRATDDGFVVDDLTGFGPNIKRTDEGQLLMSDRAWTRGVEPRPLPAPSRFKPFIGEYGWDHNTLYIFEDRGQLWAMIEFVGYLQVCRLSTQVF